MARPDPMYSRISEALSEVMDDIGVNERFVMKRRRTWMLNETIRSISPAILGKATIYYFGSQSEGSTTLGLKSDSDALYSFDFVNVIQSMSEWKHGVHNLKIIQNEKISPGYCHLQEIRSDLPLPKTVNDLDDESLLHYVTDRKGRLLLKGDSLFCIPIHQKHGPALTFLADFGLCDVDHVGSYYCKSSPHHVTSWLQKHRQRKWPTEEILKDCLNAGCFVVAVGSKVHSYDVLESKLEWRISTSLQERCLMFSLNIPQLMCYILMKMILKTHINPHVKDVLSSFMCKNIVLYCIANSSPDWHTGNLLSYLHLCVCMLKECIEQRNCPHFMIPENNLLAGRMTDTQRCKLLGIINNWMENGGESLFEIQTDDLGKRLKIKLNMIPNCPNIHSPAVISQMISYVIMSSITSLKTKYLTDVLNVIKHENLEMAHQYLYKLCSTLENNRNITVSEHLIPLVSSILGSVIANTDIETPAPISHQALTYLETGKESDAMSGRLKLVSVLYCSRDTKRTERELESLRTQLNVSAVFTKCHCYSMARLQPDFEGINIMYDNINEKANKFCDAFCTIFLHCELQCAPNELRNEILKSVIEEDRKMRSDKDSDWMDFIVVDSIPYLWFLHYTYKGYTQQEKRSAQQQALINLAQSTNEANLGHKETALNLLGQCLEQENRQTEALQCYIDSLKHRKRNNAARFLLCIHLSKLWKCLTMNK